MKWPLCVSPYECSIITLVTKNDKSNLEKAIRIYNLLSDNKIDTILDDTDENFSSKMKKFDLIGVPYQIIIGKKSDSESLEFKEIDKDIKKLKIEEIIKIIKSKK